MGTTRLFGRTDGQAVMGGDMPKKSKGGHYMPKSRRWRPSERDRPLNAVRGKPKRRATRERDFTKAVITLATLNGYLCHHIWDSRKTAGHAGFPDLVLCRSATNTHGARLIFAELKCGHNTRTPKQVVWGNALRYAGQEYHLWHESDMDTIAKVLAGEKNA